MKRVWTTIYLPKTLLEKAKQNAMRKKISLSKEIDYVLRKMFVGNYKSEV